MVDPAAIEGHVISTKKIQCNCFIYIQLYLCTDIHIAFLTKKNWKNQKYWYKILTRAVKVRIRIIIAEVRWSLLEINMIDLSVVWQKCSMIDLANLMILWKIFQFLTALYINQISKFWFQKKFLSWYMSIYCMMSYFF